MLQNENGPCPLIAAANCLLLQGRIELPPASIRNNVASLSDLTNVLANVAIEEHQKQPHDQVASFSTHEILEHIPALQYGMDVNPKFTAGIHGYEYTSQLHCFDTWRVNLCHGWLLDPHETSEDLYSAIGDKTYNQVIELVIHGSEAEQAIPALEADIQTLEKSLPPPVDLLDDNAAAAQSDTTIATNEANQQKLVEMRQQLHDLQHKATIGHGIDHFLQETGHQLTQFGLHQIHQDLPEGDLAVFFRNNHFSTITKQDGLLYLLVTDLGYAGTPQIVWEKLDMINGDTEHVNSAFKTVGQVSQENAGVTLSPETLLAQAGQKDADYHLALHLSMNESGGNTTDNRTLDAREGDLMAAATEASLREYHGMNKNTATAPEVAVGVPMPGSEGGTRVALPPSSKDASTDPDHLLALQLAQQQQTQQRSPPCDDMASLRLAQQLQAEENLRAQQQRNPARRQPAQSSSAKSSNCVIS